MNKLHSEDLTELARMLDKLTKGVDGVSAPDLKTLEEIDNYIKTLEEGYTLTRWLALRSCKYFEDILKLENERRLFKPDEVPSFIRSYADIDWYHSSILTDIRVLDIDAELRKLHKRCFRAEGLPIWHI